MSSAGSRKTNCYLQRGDSPILLHHLFGLSIRGGLRPRPYVHTHLSTWMMIGLDWTALHFTALDRTVMEWTGLHRTGLIWTVLYWSGVDVVEWSLVEWTALNRTDLHWTVLVWSVGCAAWYYAPRQACSATPYFSSPVVFLLSLRLLHIASKIQPAQSLVPLSHRSL